MAFKNKNKLDRYVMKLEQLQEDIDTLKKLADEEENLTQYNKIVDEINENIKAFKEVRNELQTIL